MTMKRCLPISGANGYLICDDGTVYSCPKAGTGGHEGKYMKLGKDGGGYPKVSLRYGDKSVTRKVHRLVAESFIENKENKPYVNHIDFDITNNSVGNLEWVTQSENLKHTWKHGRGRNPCHLAGKDSMHAKYDEYYEAFWLTMRDAGISYLRISEIFGIAHTTIFSRLKRSAQLRKLIDGECCHEYKEQ